MPAPKPRGGTKSRQVFSWKTWALLLISASPGICATIWERPAHSDADIVRLEKGPVLNFPKAMRINAFAGTPGEGRSTSISDPYSEDGSRFGFGPKSGRIDTMEAKDTESSEWETVLDPRLYLITEFAEGNTQVQQVRRRRNANPSLSIVNPLDVLRQRLLFEIARRRLKQSHSQIMANNEILRNIGRKK